MGKRKKLPSLVTIAVLTMITVVFWTGLEIYRALASRPVQDVPSQILAPINPNLDSRVLNRLQNRIDIADSEVKTVIHEVSEVNEPVSTQ